MAAVEEKREASKPRGPERQEAKRGEQKQLKPQRMMLWGRHPLTLGAAALLGISGYELWIRVEDFWAWSSGIRHLSAVRGTPFLEDLVIIFQAPEMRQLGFKLLFLLVAVVFSLVCLLRRNRPGGAWTLFALDIALAGVGAALGLYSLNPSDWAQVLKLVPIGLIAFGCSGNRVQYRVLQHKKESRDA